MVGYTTLGETSREIAAIFSQYLDLFCDVRSPDPSGVLCGRFCLLELHLIAAVGSLSCLVSLLGADNLQSGDVFLVGF